MRKKDNSESVLSFEVPLAILGFGGAILWATLTGNGTESTGTRIDGTSTFTYEVTTESGLECTGTAGPRTSGISCNFDVWEVPGEWSGKQGEMERAADKGQDVRIELDDSGRICARHVNPGAGATDCFFPPTKNG